MGAAFEAKRGAGAGEAVSGERLARRHPLPQRREHGRLAGAGLTHDQHEAGVAAAAERQRLRERHRLAGGDERMLALGDLAEGIGPAGLEHLEPRLRARNPGIAHCATASSRASSFPAC